MLTGKSCHSCTWGWLIKSHPNPQLGETALHTNTASYNKALLIGTLWGGNGNMEIRPCTTSQWLAASSRGVRIFHSPLLHFPNMHHHYSPHTGCGLNPLLLKLVNLTHLRGGIFSTRCKLHQGKEAVTQLSECKPTPQYTIILSIAHEISVKAASFSTSLWLPILNIHL